MERAILFYPNGLTKAFTISYDDGMDFDRKLVDICRAHGVKGTFNLNSGRLGMPGHRYLPPEAVKEVYTPDVAEVATHGKEHAFLTMIPSHSAALELLEDRLALEKLTGGIVRGHAYPFGAYNDQVLGIMKTVGLVYARTITSTKDFRIPEDWLRWDPTCHHDDPELMDLADKFLKRPPFFGASLFYVWGHSYEFGFKDNWSVMEQLQDKVGGREDVWYATNMEIYEYVEAFRSLIWSADGFTVKNPTNIPVWVALSKWPRRENVPTRIDPGQTVVLPE